MGHGRVWVSHLKKLEWVGYFEDEVKCGIEVNKRCIKLGLPIKNPELEIIENPSTDTEDSDQKTTDAKKTKKRRKTTKQINLILYTMPWYFFTLVTIIDPFLKTKKQ